MTEEPNGLGPGVVLKDYQLEARIGSSSLGEMYVASNIATGQKVQLEILDDSDQESIDRLSREIELLASLEHRNIVRAFDAGQESNYFYLASEYEEGITLEDKIKQNSFIEEKEALRHVVDIARALQYAWEKRKISHRDIKPENIFITESGIAKLMGFGIAKSNESQSMGLTGVGFTIGTPEYMSPEQIKAEELDYRSDMYSLGCVLYEMITGKMPFNESAMVLLMQKHMDEDPVPANEVNSAVSTQSTELVSWLMKKDREERPSNWEGFIQYVEGVISQETPEPSHDPSVAETTQMQLEDDFSPIQEESDVVEEQVAESTKEKSGCAAILLFSAIASMATYLFLR